jgi:hypothetical protein
MVGDPNVNMLLNVDRKEKRNPPFNNYLPVFSFSRGLEDGCSEVRSSEKTW